MLGGDGGEHQEQQQRAAFEITLEESKGSLSQVKVKQQQSRLKLKGAILNSTIRVEEEENECTFIASEDDGSLVLSHLKLHN